MHIQFDIKSEDILRSFTEKLFKETLHIHSVVGAKLGHFSGNM